MGKVILTDLLKELDLDKDLYSSYKNTEINNLCVDSRQAGKGDFFVAITCDYVTSNVEEAIRNGVSVVLATANVISSFKSQKLEAVIFIEYINPRLALSLLAKAYYKKQPSILMAVTGTNGKSSVVNMVQQLWSLMGKNSASFGTLGLKTNTQFNPTKNLPSLTTYDSLSFFCLLKDLAESDIQQVVFEASSIGLDQFRIHGSDVNVAAFTNFSQDHLDYHQDMENYFQAKLMLFTQVLKQDGIAVFNESSPYLERLKKVVSDRNIRTITYAQDNDMADVCAAAVRIEKSSLTFDLHYDNQKYSDIVLNLSGVFQIENVLCAISMLIATGIKISEIIEMVPKIKPIKGRMELIGQTPNGGSVYIDYAHTPDALERALKSLRIHTKNSVWVVFGCGGDRDNSKRGKMGRVASDFADKIIITDDNPRSENSANIRKQILSKSSPGSLEIADRRKAIEYAIAHLEKGDTLLIAGKGHETGQVIGNTVYPFCDAKEAERVLVRLKS